MRAGLVSVLLAGTLLGGGGGAAASPSPVRVLVAKVTWGPQPFTDAEVEVAVAPIPAFYATASFGQVSLSFAETPWLTLLSGPAVCQVDHFAIAFSRSVRGQLAGEGYPTSSYDRLVLVVPHENDCRFSGITQPAAIVMNGTASAPAIAHELGHTFGMGHAGAQKCHVSASGGRFCTVDSYGDPWDVMGALSFSSQLGDFGARQKAQAGWIGAPTDVAGPGIYQVAAIEQTSTLPQALVIRAGAFEYWVDHREPVANDAYLADDPGSSPVTGFEVHRVGAAEDALIGSGRTNAFSTPVGSTFTLPGVFSLAALSRADGVVSVRFRWLDRTKPTAPSHVSVTGSTVSFKASADTGSGVDRYLVSVDGKTVATVPELTATLPVLAPGKHTVAVVAVDRAGNRSRPVTVSIHG